MLCQCDVVRAFLVGPARSEGLLWRGLTVERFYLGMERSLISSMLVNQILNRDLEFMNWSDLPAVDLQFRWSWLQDFLALPRLHWGMPRMSFQPVSWRLDPHPIRPRSYFCFGGNIPLSWLPKKLMVKMENSPYYRWMMVVNTLNMIMSWWLHNYMCHGQNLGTWRFGHALRFLTLMHVLLACQL